MDKTMMMLVKKSASDALDKTRVEDSRHGRSISIELLDDSGNKVVSGSEWISSIFEGVDNVSRKRKMGDHTQTSLRLVRQGADGIEMSGINKTLTIIGNQGIMTHTHDSLASKKDASAFSKRSRSELVYRCLSRAGRYMSDVMYILEEFKADEGRNSPSPSGEESIAFKNEKKKLEEEQGGLKTRVR
ncbi:hypothetical protein AgCh_001166 [Apium graveolens]